MKALRRCVGSRDLTHLVAAAVDGTGVDTESAADPIDKRLGELLALVPPLGFDGEVAPIGRLDPFSSYFGVAEFVSRRQNDVTKPFLITPHCLS